MYPFSINSRTDTNNDKPSLRTLVSFLYNCRIIFKPFRREYGGVYERWFVFLFILKEV